MSGDAVAIVVRLFEDMNERDFDAVVDAYGDDMTLTLHVGEVGTDTVTGKAAVVDWFSDWFGQFRPGYRFTVDEVESGAGDTVFLVATHHGYGRASGAPVEQQTAYVFTVREDLVCAMEVWGEREPARTAAGLRAS